MAQACCAGASVVTPARLQLHESGLLGVQLRAASVHGSYAVAGDYVPAPAGDSELDLEQDMFAAVRFLGHAQFALLVPWIETERRTPQDGTHIGGGIGDVNASVRFDFFDAGKSRYVPGVALLLGATAPTGTSPEAARQSLDVDATGIGAWQAQAALALEQLEGPWLFNLTGIAAARTPRSGEQLAPQVTLLAATAYTFENDIALALSASEAFEGNAQRGSADVPFSSKRVTTFSLSALWPMTDSWRLVGGLSLEPPLGGLGANQPALWGASITVVRSWS